jgi:hypothetical protein
MGDDVMRTSEPALVMNPLEPIDVSRHHGTGPFMRSDITTAQGRSSEGPGPRTTSGRGATDFQEQPPRKTSTPVDFFTHGTAVPDKADLGGAQQCEHP